ncbi:cupin domain-containing protein [Caloramator sp. E03]|uniref:cupin domain-containing protein n=1 Tax=Caloramator sp. E03 TaxID=2576307 RepID=UPI00111056CB|nr:cupin domain-containing protein [Caloramator sp. E03]QCX33307.1 cupin domain-containing protein [Caloramator sp. E03]
MKKVEFKDVKPYKAPKHFDCSTLRLQGKDETGITKFWMGVTHFLPGGGAEYAYEDSPTEKVYVVLEGEVTVKSKTETIVLRKYDSLFIPPFEGREIINETNMPATMLVVVNY